MQKVVSFTLVVVMCLLLSACGNGDACSCDCPQCALCEQKTHSHETVNVIMDASGTTVEQDHNGNKIIFPEPVLVAEDKKVRIELVSFIQEESPWKDIGKYVTLKMTNYADYEVGVRLENLAVNNESSDASYSAGDMPNILPGETTTYYIEIRDAFNNALDSLDQLYTLKGRFKVSRRTGTNSYADAYEIPFSFPNALNGGSSSACDNSAVVTLKNSNYLGKWKVTEIKFAGEDASSEPEEDAELWESYLTAMLRAFDNVCFVFAESGDCCYHSDNGTNMGKWKETEGGVIAGTIVLVAQGDQLVEEIDGYLLYWEKVSDSQIFPET